VIEGDFLALNPADFAPLGASHKTGTDIR
jgi:hypothetical protein